MIEFSEISFIAQKNQCRFQTHELLRLHKSINQQDFSIWFPNEDKNAQAKLFYTKSWLNSKLSEAKTEIEHLYKKNKIQLIGLENPNYPKALFKLPNPPPHIFKTGSKDQQAFSQTPDTVAVVGRREAKPYTLKWMDEHLNPVLKKLKPIVISGGARGVDTKAHQLALLNECSTLYIMPSGLLNLYPPHLNQDFLSLVETGAIFISTYLPEAPMKKQNFSNRNWIIAALTQKILIMEAEIRSGTYKTAQYAQQLNLDLGVVPSFPSDLSYSGSLQLIYDGANLIRDAQDLTVFLNFKTKESFL